MGGGGRVKTKLIDLFIYLMLNTLNTVINTYLKKQTNK